MESAIAQMFPLVLLSILEFYACSPCEIQGFCVARELVWTAAAVAGAGVACGVVEGACVVKWYAYT